MPKEITASNIFAAILNQGVNMLVEKKKIRAIKGFEANGGRETTKSANCIARKMGAVGAKRGKINGLIIPRCKKLSDSRMT